MKTERNPTTFNSSAFSVSSILANSTVGTNWGIPQSLWWDLFRPYFNIYILIKKVGFLAVVVFGIFGNFMIILIMRRLPASSFGILFQVLAWSDQLVLVISPLQHWLYTAFRVPYFQSLGSFPCKLRFMIYYVTSLLSPWILVTLTVQRAMSVLWPHRINAVWTKRTSRLVAGAAIVISCLINCHFLYGFRHAPRCAHLVSWCCVDAAPAMYIWFIVKIWQRAEFALVSVIPFLLLVLSNGVLLWKLVESLRTGKRLPVQQTTQGSRHRKVSSLTMTLMTVSVAFILLTSPIRLQIVLSPFFNKGGPIEFGKRSVTQVIYQMLMFGNSAVNFYLYCLTGNKFRAEFWKIIIKCISLFCKIWKASSEHIPTTSSTMTSLPHGAKNTMDGKDKMRPAADSDF